MLLPLKLCKPRKSPLTVSSDTGNIARYQLRTAEDSVPMEKGVGGALQPISIDADACIVSTEEILRYFHSQVNRCTVVVDISIFPAHVLLY